jgi:hypothetical protein
LSTAELAKSNPGTVTASAAVNPLMSDRMSLVSVLTSFFAGPREDPALLSRMLSGYERAGRLG